MRVKAGGIISARGEAAYLTTVHIYNSKTSDCRGVADCAINTTQVCVCFMAKLASSEHTTQHECVAAGLSQQPLQQHSIIIA